MYDLINFTESEVLNSNKQNSYRKVLRGEDKKYAFDAKEDLMQSHSGDPELILVLRFKEEIKLRAVNIIAREFALPTEMNMYKYYVLLCLILFNFIGGYYETFWKSLKSCKHSLNQSICLNIFTL